ncbi:hypothetical protein [Oleiharenicola lentus]|uniref:hypothetical protein n=1 Tax=Oleiharenicola lentus TaxID=2508720 RepID=UPI003F67407B
MKAGLSLFLTLAIALPAQNSAVSDLWEKAVSAANEQRAGEALQLAAETEKILGRPAPKIESLRVYLYVAQSDWIRARSALNRYKQLTGPTANSPAHTEVLALQTQIDAGLKPLETKWAAERQQAVAAEVAAFDHQESAARQSAERTLKQQWPQPAEGPAMSTTEEPGAENETVTDAQIQSLAGDIKELMGWRNVHGTGEANAALWARLKEAFKNTPPKGELVSNWGGNMLIGFARETQTQVFLDHDGEGRVDQQLAKIIGGNQAYLVSFGGTSLEFAPRMQPAYPTGKFQVTFSKGFPSEEFERYQNQGYFCTGLSPSLDGAHWIASWYTAPLRETKPEPWVDMPAVQKITAPSAAFPAEMINQRLSAGEKLVDVFWSQAGWQTLFLVPPATKRVPFDDVLLNYESHRFVASPDAAQLVELLQPYVGKATVVKIIGGADTWVALLRPGASEEVDWVISEYINGENVTFIHGLGRQYKFMRGRMFDQ